MHFGVFNNVILSLHFGHLGNTAHWVTHVFQMVTVHHMISKTSHLLKSPLITSETVVEKGFQKFNIPLKVPILSLQANKVKLFSLKWDNSFVLEKTSANPCGHSLYVMLSHHEAAPGKVAEPSTTELLLETPLTQRASGQLMHTSHPVAECGEVELGVKI